MHTLLVNFTFFISCEPGLPGSSLRDGQEFHGACRGGGGGGIAQADRDLKLKLKMAEMHTGVKLWAKLRIWTHKNDFASAGLYYRE